MNYCLQLGAVSGGIIHNSTDAEEQVAFNQIFERTEKLENGDGGALEKNTYLITEVSFKMVGNNANNICNMAANNLLQLMKSIGSYTELFSVV